MQNIFPITPSDRKQIVRTYVLDDVMVSCFMDLLNINLNNHDHDTAA